MKKKDKKIGIQLTLNYDNELEKAHELASLLNKHFKPQIYNKKEVLAHVNVFKRKEGGHKLVVQFCNTECVNWMYERCGEYAGNKKLSDEVMNWDNESLSSFLLAYWEGDGTVDKYGRYRISTISENLASQIQLIATKLGIWNCRQIIFDNKNISISNALNSNRDSKNFRPRHEISLYGHKTADLLFKNNIIRNKNQKWRFEQNYGLYKVVSKSIEPFKGEVYNIEVKDDHSYLVEGIAVHNCGTTDENGNYEEGSVTFIEQSWVEHPAFAGSVVNFFVETPEMKISRENDRDELSRLFDSNLFERLKVADMESNIALKIARDENRIDRIAKKISKE